MNVASHFSVCFSSVAGGSDDHVEGSEGMDLVFGDNGMIHLAKDPPYKLKFATTTDDCAPGFDHITLGEGDDIAFGGMYLAPGHSMHFFYFSVLTHPLFGVFFFSRPI